MRERNILAGVFYAVGISAIAFGVYHSVKALSLTGYVVLGELGADLRSMLGLSFFIGGLLVCALAFGLQKSASD